MTAQNESPPVLAATEGAERGQNSPKFDGGEFAQAGERQQSESAVQSDNDKVLEFLSAVYPEGPWALTAIRTDKKGIETRTFGPSTADDARRWIAKYNGERNLYWSVNPPRNAITDKAKREDIKEVAYLHVDIDPRAGEQLADEHARISALVSTRLPRGVPLPTFTIFSGGGYQAFWKLQTPIPIDGDLALAEEAKRYNQQLELLFGGDNCHNIDRIMRLPGTWNVPDERKQKKGRKPALARLERADWDRIYPLSSFSKAATVQLAGDSRADVSPTITANVRRLPDVNELSEWNVPDTIKVIIVQGHDPDNPKQGDNSRSIWLWQVLCALVRCGVPDQVIYSIVTDADFGISESVLDKGSNAEKYALRQIARAKEDAINPALCELNDKHFVVGNDGGKCRVIQEIVDPVFDRPRLTRQSFEDFRNRYMHLSVQVGVDDKGKPQTMPLGKWWLGNTKRRQFETIVFVPGQHVEGAYNLWRGYAFDSIPGDRHEPFLRHAFENVCQGNRDHYHFLLSWMARAVQFPAEQGHVAVVLRGKKGVGKGFLAKHFGRLFGRHFLHISNPSHLVGNFNAHLRDTSVLFADEAFVPKDKKHESILKTLITEDMLTIEVKGQDVVQSPNFLHIVMATNDDWAVPATGDERRYFVLDAGAGKQQDSEYFGGLKAALENGGYQNLLYYLLSFDLSTFDVRAVPETRALQEQKVHGRKPWQNAIVEMAENGVAPDHDGWKRGGPQWVSAAGVLEAAGENAKDSSLLLTVNKALEPLLARDDGKLVSRNADVQCICEDRRVPIPVRSNVQYSSDLTIRRVQRRMYQLRELAAVRAALDEMGMRGEWDRAVTGWRWRGDEGWLLH